MVHPQAQKFIIALKQLGYTSRANDINLSHHTGMYLYLSVTDTYLPGNISINSKLDCFYPMIGNNKTSLGMDFIRLQLGTYTGAPTASAGEGFINFSTNSTSNIQSIKTGFTPPANQQFYHLSFNSGTDMGAVSPAQIEIGTSNGSGLLLGMKTAGGTLGNVYNTTNIFTPTQDSAANALSTQNVFLLSRVVSGHLNFLYLYDSSGVASPTQFAESPVTSSSNSFSPGQLLIGANTGGPTGGITTKKCQGASCGAGLLDTESIALLSIYDFLNNNK